MAVRRGGLIQFKVGGQRYDAKGSFSYQIANTMRESIVGQDGVHGFKEVATPPFVEGVITDSADVDLAFLNTIEDTTVTLELANGKVIVLRNAYVVNAVEGSSEEGELSVRLEGISGTEI